MSTADIRVGTPLPLSVIGSLTQLIGTAWPDAQIVSSEKAEVVFRIENRPGAPVTDEQVAELVIESGDDDPDVFGFGPEGLRMANPAGLADLLRPILDAAFELHPSAENYLEFTVSQEDGQPYLVTFCRSPKQTPAALHQAAAEDLRTARTDAHRIGTDAIYRLLSSNQGGSFTDGVKAALDAMRQVNFGA